MNFLLDVKLLLLLGVANGTPVIAHGIMGRLWARPLDGGLKLSDGQPLFGTSKPIRGVLLALFFTTAFGFAIGLSWRTAFMFAAAAMVGDISSSFIKRRMGLPASSMATGIDQIPESLLPLLVCATVLALSPLDIVAVVTCFVVGELLISRVLYRFNLRNRPY